MKTAIVCSEGGHLGQVKIIFDRETLSKLKPVFITENEKLQGKKLDKYFIGLYRTYFFKKDSLGLNVFNYIKFYFKFIEIYRVEKVKAVISTGAHLSIPAFLAAKTLGIKTFFIDTVIRVITPNWSARFCYFLSDVFAVQHKNMAKKYGKRAVYIGGIV